MQSPLISAGGNEDGRAEKLRVLHCIPTLQVGGAETQLKLLAPNLVAHGIEVAIVGRFAGRDAALLTERGVTCFPLRARGNYDPAIVTGLLRAVRQFRPAIIQTWLTQMDLIGGTIARLTTTPWIVSERSSPSCYPSGTKNRLRQWLGRHATLVANAPQGLDVWPDHPDRQVIGNGTDFAAVEAVPRGLLRDCEPFRDRTSVVTVSRLVPEKNLEVLIAAIDLLRATMPDVRLIVVGDGPERSRLEGLANTRGLDDHVVFAGFQSDPLEWVRSADVFASASLFEGHPNAVTEAAAAGVPTVLSDISMHRSLMGDAALYAAMDAPAGFATHIASLVRDAGKRDALIAAGRQAVGRFGIDAIAARYAALYARLAAGA